MARWGVKDVMEVMLKAWPVDLTEHAVDLLLQFGRVAKFEAGSVIARQGSASKGLHILLAGQADVTVLRPSGKELIINILRLGQPYSFLHIYHPDPHSSNLVARTSCEVLIVPTGDWLRITDTCPELKDAVISIIAMRLGGALEALTFSNLNSGIARLAHRLLIHVLQNRTVDATGLVSSAFEVTLTQAHLASMISLSRQRTNALLQQLQECGALQLEYGRIRINDINTLRKVIAESESQ